METLVPLRVPSYTSPEPPGVKGRPPIPRREPESMYDVGSIVKVPHTLLSSRKHFLKAELAGSRLPRAYADLSRECGKAMQ